MVFLLEGGVPVPMVAIKESPQPAGMPLGPRLAVDLAGSSPGELDDHSLVERMRAARRLAAWAESVELSAMAELDRRRQRAADRHGSWTVEMSRALADEVSAALTLSGTAASVRLGLAIALDRLLPATGRALEQGLIDAAKAKVICDGVIGVSEAVARKVEELVLPEAPRLTARQLAARVRRAVIDADPEAFERRRKATEAGRRVELYDNPDGTSDLAGRDLPADAADAAFNYLNALAAAIKADGDERPMDAIRADVLLELLRGRCPADLASSPAVPPEPAEATAPAASDGRAPEGGRAAGAASGDDSGDTGREEAAAITEAARGQLTELLGRLRHLERPEERGPLVAEAARRMKDAVSELKIRWCAIGVGACGDPVHGHDGYRPPAGMRRLVQARNGTCTFPTCRRRAIECDLDHTIPYHRGGATCPCNLAPLCRGHHRLKQTPEWTLIQLWPGVLLWIAPTGHWYLVGPDP
jgi:hypothetical protein